jgi:hypothetical protein
MDEQEVCAGTRSVDARHLPSSRSSSVRLRSCSSSEAGVSGALFGALEFGSKQ